VSDGQPAGQDLQQSGKFRIDFIDPLFAVAIHIGFVEGLLTESWAHDRTFPAFNDIANIWMFFVGLFFVIVTSWVGYHLSIERRPLKQNERFYIDIVLLVLYFFVLLYFRSPSKMCVLLVLIYVFYIAWDYYKTREYDQEFYGGGPPPTGIGYLRLCARGWFRRNSAPALIGEVVTFGWAIFFLALASLVGVLQSSADWVKFSVGIAIMIANILYRSDKRHEDGRSVPFRSKFC
jgi:hypothetical protein